MKQLLKKLAWYPPAEVKIPWSAIFDSLLSSSGDFKKYLCDYLQVKYCILGNSGRAVLYLLLEALKRKDAESLDEVLIPGYTCYSVAASAAKAGLKIKVYDIDPQTLGPDPDSLRQSASSRTLAIVHQHLFGIPTSIDGLKKIAQHTGAHLIEDAAQGLDGKLNGRPLGTLGDFGFFSFGRGKPLPVGCGGALVGRDQNILSELEPKITSRGFTQLTMAAATQVISWPDLYRIPEMLPLGLGETIFDPNFEIASMPLLSQKLAEKSMSTLYDLNTHRRHLANIYKEAFDDEHIISDPKGSTPVYTRFPLMAGPGSIPKELKRLGVRRMYPKAIVDEKTIKPYLGNQQVSTLGAAQVAQNLITLPTHTGITENLAKEIAQKVRIFLGHG
ncbi:MAG: DegT/DnrJ/EryC1/StrS family aminotransferase [Thermodesulfobacteriota bacterium]|nr:DegT/DnrJ/EryC1/StrS family aminotransferase [Thermodesulfobacteriota bacterium]